MPSITTEYDSKSKHWVIYYEYFAVDKKTNNSIESFLNYKTSNAYIQERH